MSCYSYILRHDFYNIIFTIKHKLYIASGSTTSSCELQT